MKKGEREGGHQIKKRPRTAVERGSKEPIMGAVSYGL